MILSKNQIDRYLRHIIMPEISGRGQKKLLESSVFICGENVRDVMPLTLYLAAMGIGKISCKLWDDGDYGTLFSQATDLNSDLNIELTDDVLESDDLIIVMGNISFIKRIHDSLKTKGKIKTLYSVFNNWRFFIAESAHNDLLDVVEILNHDSKENIEENVFFVSALAGAICSIEAVKQILSVGNVLKDILLFDLYKMKIELCEIDQKHKVGDFIYTIDEDNYDELSADKLKKARVLVVGAGGLGSPSSLALALAGVGTIGLVDADSVEESNLNRQVLHGLSRLKMPKVESAKTMLKSISESTNIYTHIESLTKENCQTIIEGYDLVISAVDNIQTRYLINDICYFLKKPVVEAGVLRFDGTNTSIIPDKGHCYRCLYPNLNTSGMSCAETGVLGAVPGVMGFIQAAEAYKIITGKGTTLQNKILLFDGLEMEFNVISLDKNPDCPLCGNNPSIKELIDYSIICKNDV